MPVNTSSTGATYGKSTDPLCPLGFHPQVRWPTRCKRCFRDYKEHSDSADQKKFSGLSTTPTPDNATDPWSLRKNNFQKSRSVDVNIEAGSSAAARFAEYTTTASTAASSKTEEDIPEWKKAMLDRRKKEKEKEEEEAKARNFGFVPGTTLHSSYVNKSYDSDARLNTWGSASNLRSSSYTNLNEAAEEDSYSRYSRSKREESAESKATSTSSWSSRATSDKKTEAELTPYEKYLQRKKEQEKKDDEDNRKKEEDKKEDERKRRREEERKREEEAEKEKK